MKKSNCFLCSEHHCIILNKINSYKAQCVKFGKNFGVNFAFHQMKLFNDNKCDNKLLTCIGKRCLFEEEEDVVGVLLSSSSS